MFILVTSEQSSKAEKEQLQLFFKNGLRLLHVRKPAMEEEELKAWLSHFETEQLGKMVLHQHHHLAEVFPLKGIHLKESFRREHNELQAYGRYRAKGFSVSSSYHGLEVLEREVPLFDYVFLSPVFTSISKSSYQGQAFNVEAMPQKIIALGGIEAATISKAKELGYAGVAVLGAVWLAENQQQGFTELLNTYRNVYD